MKKNKIISIICGLVIIITIIIMTNRLGTVAQNFCMHMDWSLGVEGAVQTTAMFYGIIIGIFTIVLVLINTLKK